jgi:hypothetical protein
VSEPDTSQVISYGETKPKRKRRKQKSKHSSKTKTQQQFEALDLRAASAQVASANGSIYENLKEGEQLADANEYLDEKGNDR